MRDEAAPYSWITFPATHRAKATPKATATGIKANKRRCTHRWKSIFFFSCSISMAHLNSWDSSADAVGWPIASNCFIILAGQSFHLGFVE